MGNKCGAKEADQMIANTEPQKEADKNIKEREMKYIKKKYNDERRY